MQTADGEGTEPGASAPTPPPPSAPRPPERPKFVGSAAAPPNRPSFAGSPPTPPPADQDANSLLARLRRKLGRNAH